MLENHTSKGKGKEKRNRKGEDGEKREIEKKQWLHSQIRYMYSRLIRERLSLESVKACAILVEAGLPLLDESLISAQGNNETTKDPRSFLPSDIKAVGRVVER